MLVNKVDPTFFSKFKDALNFLADRIILDE